MESALQSKLVAAKDQVHRELDGEFVILNLSNSQYYSLNEVGSRIWSLVQQPISINEIRNAVIDEYEVDPEQCERELLVLLEQLHREGLIEILDEKDA
ncbi:MAG: lasso peptide biosynthesis PqqD family chaperone [Pseudomonadota bacterium]